MTAPAAKTVIFHCEECGWTGPKDLLGPALYDCANGCGAIFNRSQTEGYDHQCPECYRFGSKINPHSCPECEVGKTVCRPEDQP